MELKKQYHWISIEDSLPPYHQSVLVAVSSFVTIAERNEYFHRWQDMGGFPLAVTHWMPLPELPNNKKTMHKWSMDME